jgi:Putative beta-barrel porin-2, OmpL-like. bbp2
MQRHYFSLAALAVGALTLGCGAPPPAAGQSAAPSPITTPAITGPLQAPAPNLIGGEKLPDISVNGVVTGMGLWQGNPLAGDATAQAAASNAEVFIQKSTGWWQFYLQAGAYDIPILGTPFLATDKTTSLFGPVPVAYLKLAGRNTALLAGSLPSLMGAESTFTFQNMNVSRGLLWNQENDVNRGIQLNQTLGKLTAAVSWNDGFYSNRYSWLSAALTYASGAHTVAFTAMGNLGQTAFRTLTTPLQNNSSMYALIYTYSKGKWIVQPYVQYTDVPTNRKAGIGKGASTTGGALLVSHTLRHGFSLAGRGEYLASSGGAADGSVNLLYGPGSAAWSATLTPTLQAGRFFVRGDLSVVRVNRGTPGYAFGSQGRNRQQPRAAIEAGFLF